MENPFETGHIRNYILLYASIVVIMVLFFVASTLFNEVESIDKKVFLDENSSKFPHAMKSPHAMKTDVDKNVSLKFKLMDKVY